jgi:subtilisin-like proprotein convertase family protein
MRIKVPLFLFALGLATVALATPTSLTVQFVNTSGVPITDAEVGVYDDGVLIQKLAPAPTYDVIAEKGTKVLFHLDSPYYGAFDFETWIPSLAVEPYQIVVPDPPIPQQAPPNDLCGDAVPVLLPSVTAGTTVGATTDSEQPSCAGASITSPGVWYEFIGTGNQVTADLCNGATNYDSKLSVYCLDCADPVCAANGNDDFCGLQSQVTACTQPGAVYRVLVHGFGGSTGSFELTLTEGTACTADVECVPPPPTGACCDCDAEGFNCEQLSAEMCAAMGKDYYGDDVPCTTTSGMPFSYTNTPGVPIVSNTEVSDTISVPDSLIVGDVNVGVVIDHTWIGDLVMTLVAPNGDEIILWDRACSSEDNLDVVFDDAGGTLVCASPTLGVITPVSADGQELGGLNSLASFGDWTLRVADEAGGDEGTWISWTLEIDTGIPTCPAQNDGTCFLCDGSMSGKTTICHYPPGNPENRHTIMVGAPSVPAHLAHGDTLGPCPDDGDGNYQDPDTGLIDPVSEGGEVIHLMLDDDTHRGEDYATGDESAQERTEVRRTQRAGGR